MNILQEIAKRTKARVEEEKRQVPLCRMIEMAREAKKEQGLEGLSFPFEAALKSTDIAFICEVKKASPSKGLIAKAFPYVEIAKEYERAGAAAISVLTEPDYFKGHNTHLQEIAKEVSIPLLRKDFVVDEYMIYQGKVFGASAVLLICSILEERVLKEYIQMAHSLGLSALVEVHDEEEVQMALGAGARIIGVNNRDLKTFEVDVTLSERLRKLVPSNVLFISESGIKSPEDVERMRKIGAQGVLIGESFMKVEDKYSEINRLRGNPHG